MGLFRKKSTESPPEETGDATTEATDGMKICDSIGWGNSCGDEFNEAAARKRFNRKFPDDYDDFTEGRDVCFRCAALEEESLIDQGLAIMMVNGDEDYDEDHVERWL